MRRAAVCLALAAGACGSGAPGSRAMDAPVTRTQPGVVAAGVRWIGRADFTDPDRPRFSWSGTGYAATFTGTSLTDQTDGTGPFIFKPVIDGVPGAAFTVPTGPQSFAVAIGLAPGTHTVAR